MRAPRRLVVDGGRRALEKAVDDGPLAAGLRLVAIGPAGSRARGPSVSPRSPLL
ncbi:hypothetical protein [Sphingomonas sp.]|uniref:hypothetical protein n=1 Tax=Sphingomonas sp. TaxID=28214 RepID=UPI0031D01502